VTKIECRAPLAGEWVRVRPDPAYRQEAVLARDEGYYYLIAPQIVPELEKLAPDCIERSMLFTVCNRDGAFFLWPGEVAHTRRASCLSCNAGMDLLSAPTVTANRGAP